MGATANLGLPYPENTDPLGDMALAIKALANAVDVLNGGAWTAYTPDWINSGAVQPAIGNGSIVGRYRKVGRTVQFRVVITCGTTTTYGTAGGQFSIGLPAQAHGTGRQICHGDAGIGSTYGMRGRIEASAYTAALWTPGTAAGGADRAVTTSQPAVWTTGSVLVLAGTYEAAN